jgi:uncharacterized protein with HEPN domain
VKDDKVYLNHIRDAISQIISYVSSGQESFFGERIVQDAVVRNLEIIGEAVKHLSQEVKDRQPHIPWAQIAGMRDVLVHDYFGVDLKIVWDVVQNRLPELLETVGILLEVPQLSNNG